MSSLAATSPGLPRTTRLPLDQQPWVRLTIAASATLLTSLFLYGFVRWSSGLAPDTPWVRNAALAIHLVTVVPAIPLGAYVLLAKKGGTRHRRLGALWLALMLVTATSTIFIRDVNDGDFSFIHLLTLVSLISIPRAFFAARRGDIVAHRRHVLIFYTSALMIAGFFTLMPGRTMWQWAFA